MAPQEYLEASYYERWFHAITTLLVEKGVLTAQEVTGD
jgi:nitrile hydratase